MRNRPLASLPENALAGLLPKLSSAALVLRQTLYDPESLIDAVYFPESGMVSLVANMAEGIQAEVGIVGQEGMLWNVAALGSRHLLH